MVIGIIVALLVVVPVIYGCIGAEQIHFELELNTFKTPFYRCGIAFNRYPLEDGSVEDELHFGLFLINVVIVFWKPVH